MGECASEDVPVAEVDDGEEDGASLVPLFQLIPLIWRRLRVVTADGLVAVGGCELVEADGVNQVLAVALELGSGEGIGVTVPIDVGQQLFGVATGGVSSSGPGVIDPRSSADAPRRRRRDEAARELLGPASW